MSFTRQPDVGQALHEDVVLLLVPDRTRRAVLVVADATIDQDVVRAGLHDIGLEAQHQASWSSSAVGACSHDRFSASISGVSFGRNSSAGVKPHSISMIRWTVMSPTLNVVVVMAARSPGSVASDDVSCGIG